MPIVSGYVYYSANSSLTPGNGIRSVPVALYDPNLGVGAVALTDTSGGFTFTNVPNGTYKLIETWGTAGSTTPVNYATAVAPMALPPEVEPPLTALSVTPPALAAFLNAITPNTIDVTVAGVDIANQLFYDAPVGDKPLDFTGVTFSGPNLITSADNGTWGSIAPGSAVNTIPLADPYPGVSPGFTYVASSQPFDGFFTVSNTRRALTFPWWNVSDHTSKVETGRFMTINGSNPKSIIFTETVTVAANTDYAFTGWVLNLMTAAGANPQLSFKVLDSAGGEVAYQILNSINPTTIPVWYQNGVMFNSGANTTLTVEILSEGPATTGNDFLLDDLGLYKANIADLLTVGKEASPGIVYISDGTDIEVVVSVTNTSMLTLHNVFFKDILDPTISFVTGSVTVNGSSVGYTTADPNVGFLIGDLAPNQVKTVRFHATTLDGASPITNTATAAYDIITSENGDSIKNTVDSNTVYIRRLRYNFAQASTDLTQSVALEQTGLSHILNAEGEKIQAALANPSTSPNDLLNINSSVQSMIDSISLLEQVLQNKLKIIQPQMVDFSPVIN